MCIEDPLDLITAPFKAEIITERPGALWAAAYSFHGYVIF